MCSINGVFNFNKNTEEIHSKLLSIVCKAENRGRDGFGIAQLTSSSDFGYKNINKVSSIPNLFEVIKFNQDSKVYLTNNRAEPTTEFYEHHTSSDHLQPYSLNGLTIVHNGTISNDRDLELKHDIKKLNEIDSSIFPPLLNKVWDKSLEDLKRILTEEILGSFALAIYDQKFPNKVILATNYKPLFIAYDSINDCLFFSSEKENFGDVNIFNGLSVQEVKPYSILEINDDKTYTHMSLYPDKEKKKALVICSAGLDSTVCISWAKNQGYDVSLLHFNYQCKAENAENIAISNISNFFKSELITIPVDFFKNIIKHSPLLSDTDSINMTDTGVEFALEWVPARNLIFMSIAAGYAEANNFDYIILGGNLEEAGAYPDNEAIFMKKFNDLLPNSLGHGKRVEVLLPVANLMKKEIVKLGLDLKAPLHLTWSCYLDGDIHCGKCGPCRMRKKAFKILNQKEVIKYKDEN